MAIKDYLNVDDYGEELADKGVTKGEADKPMTDEQVRTAKIQSFYAPYIGGQSHMATTDSSYDISDVSPLMGPEMAESLGGYQDIMAQDQSNWAYARNLAGQTLGSIVIGTAGGFATGAAALGDLTAGIFTGEDEKMRYAMDDMFQGLKQATNEAMPMYQTKEQEAETFNPGSAQWWAKNTPDLLGSAISLLAAAYTGGAAAETAVANIAKMTGMASKFQNASKIMGTTAKVLGSATTSRYLESLQEANGSRNESLERGLNNGLSFEEANAQASKEASRVFSGDMYMIASDIAQFGLAFTPLSSLGKGAKGFKKFAVGTTKGAFGAASEAGEEAFQTIQQKEARLMTENNKKYTDESVWDRVPDYLYDDEVLASASLGAVGGVIFEKAAPALNKVKNKAAEGYAKMDAVVKTNNKQAFKLYRDKNISKQIITNAILGKHDNSAKMVESLKNLPDETLAKYGIEREELDKNLDRYTGDIEYAAAKDKELQSNSLFENNKAARDKYIALGVEKRMLDRNVADINDELNDMYADVQKEELAPELANYKRDKNELNELKNTRKSLKSIKNTRGNKVYSKEQVEKLSGKLDRLIARKQKALDLSKKSIKEANPEIDFTNGLTTSRDAEIAQAHKVLNDTKFLRDNSVQPEFAKVSKLKTLDEVSKLNDEETKKWQDSKNSAVKKSIDNAKTFNDISLNLFDAKQLATNGKELASDIDKKADNQITDAPVMITDDFTNSLMSRYEGRPHLAARELPNLVNRLEKGNFTGDFKDTVGDIREGLYGEKPMQADEIFEYIDSVLQNDFGEDDRKETESIIAEFSKEMQTIQDVQQLISIVTKDKPAQEVAQTNKGVIEQNDTPIDTPPTTGAIMSSFTKYKMKNGQIEYDKNGNPIPYNVVLNSPIDYKYIYEGNVRPESEVEFAIAESALNADNAMRLNDQYHSAISSNEFSSKNEILIIHRDEVDNPHVVGALNAFNKNNKQNNSTNLLELRNAINIAAKNAPLDNGFVFTGITSEVEDVYTGRFVRTNKQTDVRNVLRKGEPLILGVTTPIAAGSNYSKLSVTGNVAKEYKDVATPSTIQKGYTYMLLKAPDGSIKPARVFTRKLSENKEYFNEVKEMFDKITPKEAAAVNKKIGEYIYAPFTMASNELGDMIVTFYNENGVVKKIPLANKKEIYNHLGDRMMQVDLGKINTGDYNDRIAENNYIFTKLKEGEPMANPTLVLKQKATTAKVKVKVEVSEPVTDIAKDSNTQENVLRTLPEATTVNMGRWRSDGGFKSLIVESIDSFLANNTIPEDLYSFIGVHAKFLFQTSDEAGGMHNLLDNTKPIYKGNKELIDSIANKKFVDRAELIEYRNSFAKKIGMKLFTETTAVKKEPEVIKEPAVKDEVEISAPEVVKEPKVLDNEYKKPKSRLKVYFKHEGKYVEIKDPAMADQALKTALENSYADASNTGGITPKEAYQFLRDSGYRLGSEAYQSEVKKYVKNRIKGNESGSFEDFFKEMNRSDKPVVKEPTIEPTPVEKTRPSTKEAPKDKLVEPNKPAPKIKADVGDLLSGINIDFSKLRAANPKGVTDRMDVKKSLAWFKSRFPDIDVQIFNDLIEINKNGGVYAWGTFKSGIIQLYEGAEKGTIEHEAFHMVFNMMLNEDQRSQIYKDATKRYGNPLKYDTDYLYNQLGETYRKDNGREITKTELNRLWLEEKMAEEYSMKALDSTKKVETNSIRKLFNRIKYFFTSKIARNLKLDQLFTMMDTGYYKNRPMVGNSYGLNSLRTSLADYNLIDVNNMASTFAESISQVLDAVQKANPGLSRVDTINAIGINKLLIHSYNQTRDYAASMKEDGSISESQSVLLDRFLNNYIIEDEETGKMYVEEVGVRVLRKLHQTEGITVDLLSKVKFSEGVKYNPDSNLSEDENELFTDEDTFLEAWQLGKEHISLIEKMPASIKRKLSRIKIPGKKDTLGFSLMLDFKAAYATMIKSLADNFNTVDMKESMRQLVETRPEFSVILEEMEDPTFLGQVFNAMQSTYNNYMYVQEVRSRTGNVLLVGSSNQSNVQSLLMNEWKASFTNPSMNPLIGNDGKLKDSSKELFGSYIPRLDKVRMLKNNKSTPNSRKLILEVANTMGLSLEEQDLINISEYPKTPAGRPTGNPPVINNLIDELFTLSVSMNVNNSNIFDTSDQNIHRSINEVVKSVAAGKLEVYESSARNAKGKTVYANQTPNFLAMQMKKFKQNKDLINEYLGSTFFKHSPWIKEMNENFESLKDVMEVVSLDGYKRSNSRIGSTYTDLTDKELELSKISLFFNNGNKKIGHYALPVISDTPRGMFFKFKKFNRAEVISQLTDVARQELDRIDDVINREKIRKEFIANGKNVPDEYKAIKNYDSIENSAKFLLLPFLNENINENITALKSGNSKIVEDRISEFMAKESKNELDRLTTLGVFTEKDGRYGFQDSRFNVANDFNRYFYNSVLANTQLTTLFTGDIAYYKADSRTSVLRTVDYSKRVKEITSPKTVFNENASYKMTEAQREAEGAESATVNVKKIRRMVYLKDTYSDDADMATRTKDALLSNGVSEKEATRLSEQYRSVNVTDGGSLISLDDYRNSMVASQLWNADLQDSFTRLKNKVGTTKDIKNFMVPVKPFQFGMNKVGSNMVPTQIKDSEAIVFPQYGDNSEFYRDILDFMEKENIDKISWDSAVKVGTYGAAEDFKTLDAATIHELPLTDSGIQMDVPEHLLDHDALFGVQIRKIIESDIPEDAIFNYGDKQMTKRQLISTYQALIYSNVKNSYEDMMMQEELSVKKLSKMVTKELNDKGYGEDYLDAVRVVTRPNPITGKMEKQFNLPLYSPFVSKDIEQVIHAMFKNRITKQRIKGGQAVQISDVGYADDLKITYKDYGDGRKGIDEIQCKMPWYTQKILEPLMDENGQVDISKIKDERLLQGVGYRIPTEYFYSLYKLKIVGFLPREQGGALMLPKEVTTLSGSDFDIDKVYLMLREFNVIKDDNGNTTGIEYLDPKLDEIIESLDNNKIVSHLDNMSTAAKNNAMLELMDMVLGHPSSVEKTLNPGSFDTLVALAREISPSGQELVTILPGTQAALYRRNMAGKKLIGIAATATAGHSVLQNFNIKIHDKDAIRFNGNVQTHPDNPAYNLSDQKISKSLAEFLAAFVDNAKDPIASFLNINEITFNVAGIIVRTGYSLRTMALFLNQPIIREVVNDAQLLGGDRSSYELAYNKILDKFDNKVKNAYEAKDNMLNDSDMSESLSKKVNYNYEDFKVLSIFEKYRTGAGKSISDLTRAAKTDGIESGPTLSENQSRIDNQISIIRNEGIAGQAEIFLGKSLAELYENQGASNVISEILSGDSLNMWNPKTNRYDTVNGPFRYYKEDRTNDFMLIWEGGSLNLLSDWQNIREVHNQINLNICKEFTLPGFAGFDLYGIKMPTQDMSAMYPWINDAFKGIRSSLVEIAGRNLGKDDTNKVNMAVMEYISSKTDFMKVDNPRKFMEDMADEFKTIKAENPELVSTNVFLKKLFLDSEIDSDLTSIGFLNNGSISKDEAQEIKEYWSELLQKGGKIGTFAENLVKYTILKHGFYMNPKTFTRFIPTAYFTEAYPKGFAYMNQFKELTDGSASNLELQGNFIEKYLRSSVNLTGQVTAKRVEKGVDFDGKILHSPSMGDANTRRNLPIAFSVDLSKEGFRGSFLIDNQDGTFTPREYVTIKYENKFHLMKPTTSRDFYADEFKGDANIFVPYHLVESLSKKGELVETGLNVDESIFDRNKINPRSKTRLIEMLANPTDLIKLTGHSTDGATVNTNNVIAPIEEVETTTDIGTKPAKENLIKTDDGITLSSPFKLNDQQLNAIKKITDFLKGKDTVFILKGYAGTGKTSLMQMIDQYRNKFVSKGDKWLGNIVFSSPTHRANSVLASKTGQDVKTLHSLFGLEPSSDLELFDAKNMKFKKGEREPKLEYGETLIIDESSMINDSLFDFIKDFAEANDNKIIFIGDPAQLQPVKQESLSKALFSSKNIVGLTKVERTGDNALLSFLTNLRNNKAVKYTSNVNKDGEGIKFLSNKKSFIDSAADMFASDAFKQNPLLLRVLSYTNSNVSKFNDYIRRKIWSDNEVSNEYNVGELLMGYSNQGEVKNSVDYSVVNSTKIENRDLSLIDSAFKGIKVDGYSLEMKDLMSNEMLENKVFILDKNTSLEKQQKIARVIDGVFKRAAQKKGKSRYTAFTYAYRLASSVLSPVSIAVDGRVIIKPALQYGYAHTVHKSQGGTYDNVYVDTTDFSLAGSKKIINQLWYVALSRASKKASVLVSQSEMTVEEKKVSPTEAKPTGHSADGAVSSTNNVIEPIDNTTPIESESKKTLTFHWGKNLNKKFSNLAPRNFSYEGYDGVTREYQSVEHAYQTLKNGTFNESVYNRPQDFVGTKRSAPKLTERGKRGNAQIMKDLIKESLLQNPELLSEASEYTEFKHPGNTDFIDRVVEDAFREAVSEKKVSPTEAKPITKDVMQFEIGGFAMAVVHEGANWTFYNAKTRKQINVSAMTPKFKAAVNQKISEWTTEQGKKHCK